MKSLFAALSLLFLIGNAAFSQAYILDESYKDKDFLAFKIKLVKALVEKDESALISMLDSEIEISHYERPGIKSFKEYYFSGNVYDKDFFWKNALKLASFGFREGEINDYEKEKGYSKAFYAPSFHKDLGFGFGGYNDKYDSKCLVLGDNVNVREKPTTKSKVLGKLSYELVETNLSLGEYWQPEIMEKTEREEKYPSWYEVKLKNGKIGYIVADYISDNYMIDFRVAKTKNGWKVVRYYMPPGC